MKIALASPRIATSVEDGLERVKRLMLDAASRGASIVCFPEAYLPGLRGLDFPVPEFEKYDEARVLRAVGDWSREFRIATIVGVEHLTESGRHIAAAVFDRGGAMLGMQLKNQLDPTEEGPYVPGEGRQLFEIDGLKFGIAICHEGWRYPETVRWAATRGAHIVFHPHHTGSDQSGPLLTEFGSTDAPYYEKAMVCRSIENTIYFASVNYATRFPESATALIAPSGELQAFLPYGEEGVLVEEIDLNAATGLLAKRYKPIPSSRA